MHCFLSICIEYCTAVQDIVREVRAFAEMRNSDELSSDFATEPEDGSSDEGELDGGARAGSWADSALPHRWACCATRVMGDILAGACSC